MAIRSTGDTVDDNSGEGRCPSEASIVEYVDRLLPAEARRRIDTHLDGCPRCHSAAVELAALDQGAGADGEDPAGPEAPLVAQRYVLHQVIGAGAMGTVYAALDRTLDRVVALKIIRPTATRTTLGDATSRIRREARALARLHHAHIVEVFDVGQWGSQVFIAMQYVRGATLREWLSEPKRPWLEVAATMRAAASALAAAHAQGIVHRDFKPDNVVFGDDGILKVVDFGLARAIESVHARDTTSMPSGEGAAAMTDPTETHRIVGSPAYMAPEVVRGEVAGAGADQYAFFVTLFEGLCGHRPFDAATHRRIDTSSDRWSPLPRWLRRLIVRGLAEDPAHRWPTMEAVEQRLVAGMHRARRRRRPGGAAVVGVAGMAAVAVLADAWGQPAPAPVTAATPVEDPGALPPDDALVQARHLADAGRLTDARRIAAGVATDRAQSPQQRMKARVLEGLLADADGDPTAAAVALQDAFELGLPVDAAVAAEAAAALAGLWAREGDGAAAERWLRHAEAALARTPIDPEHSYDLALARGIVLDASPRTEQAVRAHEHCLAVARDEQERGTAATNLANALARREDFERASAMYAAALRHNIAAFGATHPYTVSARINLAASHLERGDAKAAQIAVDEVLALDLSTFPAALRSAAWGIRGTACGRLGDHAGSKAAHQAALVADQSEFGVGHPATAQSELNLGVAYERDGACDLALQHALRARTLLEGAGATESTVYGQSLFNAAAALDCLGDRPQAVAYGELARDVFLSVAPTSATVAEVDAFLRRPTPTAE